MKKIVFILLIFCSFLVVWGCNKNKTKCVPQKEATSDSSMRSNDDTLSLMIEHEVDDVDYGVIIKRGDKTTTKVLSDLFDIADDLNNKIANEIIERINADKDLKGRIEAETNNREKADRDMLELINQKYADLLKRLNDLLADQGKLTNALTKIINNLRDSGAWSGGIEGQFNNGRNIATGNINLFSSTVDGDYFIRTNNGRTENDLAGGV